MTFQLCRNRDISTLLQHGYRSNVAFGPAQPRHGAFEFAPWSGRGMAHDSEAGGKLLRVDLRLLRIQLVRRCSRLRQK